MEFFVDVQRPKGDTQWTVTVRDASGQPVLLGGAGGALVRTLQERKTSTFIVPLTYPELIDADVVALGDVPHKTLCIDADAVAKAHQVIVAPDGLASPDMVTFGRFLFELLLGQAWWQELHTRAGAGPIELSLRWKADDIPLQRLPWEMMHNGERFLGQEGQFALIRRVTETKQTLSGIVSPPRVLFVVGTELQNDVIRPGAEYLRLLQGLRVAGLSLSLRTRLLLRTTQDRLETALDEFKPDVVHFICHGRFDDEGRCSLELVDQNDKTQPWRVDGGALADLLQKNGRQPQVVVLSACYTSAQNLPVVGQVAAPFAAELVEGGIPIAVGMGGRITDQACRLFTRRFYEALLKTGDFAHATAEGRRAAIRDGGTNPDRTADWTMPTIFLSAAITGTSVKVTLQAVEQAWYEVAAQYSPGPFPVFCDRLEILERFDTVMAGSAAQRAATHVTDLQLLAIASRHMDSADQYGRTWLMKELAAKSVRDGHVAVMIGKREVLDKADWPKTGRALAEFIFAAARNTLSRFRTELRMDKNLCPVMPTLRRVLDLAGPPPADLPQDLQDAAGDPNGMLAAALRIDLLDMLQAARLKRPDGIGADTRLVLLIDDLHRMGKEAIETLKVMCGTQGLRSARHDIRVVLLYSSAGLPEQMPAINELADWLSESAWAQVVELDGFRTPHEEREAYEYFLLNWVEPPDQRPLVTRSPDQNLIDGMFKSLCSTVAGVPSRLPLQGVGIVNMFLNDIKDSTQQSILRPAEDEAALKRAQQFIRGRP